MKWNRPTILGMISLAVILVGMPLVSLYYLNKGLDYRRSQIEKLDMLGRAELISAKNAAGFTLDSMGMIGHITVFADEALGCAVDRVTVKEYVEKFVKYDMFNFVTLADGDCDQVFDIMYNAPKSNNPALAALLRDLVAEIGPADALALADRRGQIRKVYDITKKEDLEALVAHTSVLLPPQKNRD